MAESTPRRRRRWLILVVLLALAVTANISLATYVYFFYDGSTKVVAPGDARLMTDYISNFFCKAEQVQLLSSDPTLHFDASVIPGDKLNDRMPKTDHINVSPLLKGDHQVDLWPLYLPSGAQISLKQCTGGNGRNKVMSAIVKGEDVDEDCIKFMWKKYILEEDESHFFNPCPQIIVNPYLLQHCGGSSKQTYAKIKEDGYFAVIFDNTISEQVQVVANISISRLTYDLRSSLANCTSTKFCVLPLRFWSSDSVVVDVAMNTKETKVSVTGSCIRQSATFGTVFAGLPLLLFVIIIILVACSRKKKRQRGNSSSVHASETDPTQREPERTPLLDTVNAYHGTVPAYGTTAFEVPDPILAKTGPIPGPYQYRPSAPPNLSPEILTTDTQQGEQSFTYPTEPPPTYEETMKTPTENETNPFTKES